MQTVRWSATPWMPEYLNAKCINELQNKNDINENYEKFKASSEKIIRDQKDMISKLLWQSNKIEYQNTSIG